MQRYFIDDVMTDDIETIAITDDDARHIAKVMRMQPDDKLTVCDASGQVARCRITNVEQGIVTVAVEAYLDIDNEMPVQVTIAQGLPKGDKLELTVQKGTEYGATAFLPFTADRSIVKWDEKKKAKRTARLHKITKEAAEQAFRNQIPHVAQPVSFTDILAASADYDVCITPFEDEATGDGLRALRKVITTIPSGASVLIVIGPEGGLSEREISEMRHHGFQTCGLGPRILRTETAALYFMSVLSYEFE